MKPPKASLLLHPAFIISLFTLLLNDFYWKYEYHNWLTGKLSDFAGLIVLPVFLIAFLPYSRKAIVLFSALLFIWWKTPLSEFLIHFFNQQCSLPVRRVVDYTDLFALVALPFANTLRPVYYNIDKAMHVCFRSGLALLAFISLCSTSVAYREAMGYGTRENEVGFYETFKSEKTEDQLVQTLKDKRLIVYQDTVRYYPVRNDKNLYYRLRSPTDSSARWVTVPHSKDSAIYLRRTSTPFYVIPLLVLEGDTLKNLEFTIATNNKKKKKSTVEIESFQNSHYSGYYSKQRKQYKKYFENLFSD